MKLDLRRDFDEIYAYLDRARADVRLEDQRRNGQARAGQAEPDRVRLLAGRLGRRRVRHPPESEAHGEWNAHSDGNVLERPDWLAAGEANMEGPITLILGEGRIPTGGAARASGAAVVVLGLALGLFGWIWFPRLMR